MGSMFGGGSSSQDFAQNFQRLPQQPLPAMLGQNAVMGAQKTLGANPQAYGQNYQALINAMLARRPGAMPTQAYASPVQQAIAPQGGPARFDLFGPNRERRNFSYARDGGGFQMDRSRSVGGIGSDYAADKARR